MLKRKYNRCFLRIKWFEKFLNRLPMLFYRGFPPIVPIFFYTIFAVFILKLREIYNVNHSDNT